MHEHHEDILLICEENRRQEAVTVAAVEIARS